MSLPIQTSDPQTRLVKRYATVGRVDLRLDETVVPVVILDDVRETGESQAGVVRDRQAVPAAPNVAAYEFRLPNAPSSVVAQTSRLWFSHTNLVSAAVVSIWVALPNNALGFGDVASVFAQRNWRDQGNVGLQIGSFPAGGVGGRKPTLRTFVGTPTDLQITNLGNSDYTHAINQLHEQPLDVTLIPGGSIYLAVDGGLDAGDLTFASLEFVEQPRRA